MTTKLGRFLSKLYSVAILSVGLAGVAGQAASFSPLQGTAAGLGVILQLLNAQSNRGDDFLSNLRRIEFQAAIIAENPTYDLNVESTRSLVEEKARDLCDGGRNGAMDGTTTRYQGRGRWIAGLQS